MKSGVTYHLRSNASRYLTTRKTAHLFPKKFSGGHIATLFEMYSGIRHVSTHTTGVISTTHLGSYPTMLIETYGTFKRYVTLIGFLSTHVDESGLYRLPN